MRFGVTFPRYAAWSGTRRLSEAAEMGATPPQGFHIPHAWESLTPRRALWQTKQCPQRYESPIQGSQLERKRHYSASARAGTTALSVCVCVQINAANKRLVDRPHRLRPRLSDKRHDYSHRCAKIMHYSWRNCITENLLYF